MIFEKKEGTPINSFEVAIKIGLTVVPYSALNRKERRKAMKYSEDGYSVETNEGEWIIYYNDMTKDYTRINQTIIHEVGHYILGHVVDNFAIGYQAANYALKYYRKWLWYGAAEYVTYERQMLLQLEAEAV